MFAKQTRKRSFLAFVDCGSISNMSESSDIPSVKVMEQEGAVRLLAAGVR